MTTFLDGNSSQLFLIYYPSGGYGYYLTRLINLAIKDVVHTNDPLTFDSRGTSHSCPTVVPSISPHNFKDLFLFVKPELRTQVLTGLPIIIPVCPGSNENSQILNVFPNATSIKIVYDDLSWPLIFHNCIHKAQNDCVENQIKFDQDMFGEDTPCARRENYRLFLKNSLLRKAWKDTAYNTVKVSDLIIDPLKTLSNLVQLLNSTIQNAELIPIIHNKFLQSNPAIHTWLKIKDIVDNIHVFRDLSDITELYWQAVFDFYIEEKFQIEIPVNDYPNWFTNTHEVVTMIDRHGVDIDSN